MIRFSASKADLAAACSHWLKDGSEWVDTPDDSGLSPRDVGIAFHELAARFVGGVPLDRFLSFPKEVRDAAMTRFEGWHKSYQDGLAYQKVRAEVIYILDIRSGLSWAFDGDFQAYRQSRPSHELPIIIDMIVLDENDRIGVIDLKTGQDVIVPVSRSLQLLTAAYVTGADWMAFEYVDEKGGRRVRSAEVHHERIDWAIDQLRMAMANVDAGPTPGEHCHRMYCPHMLACKGVAEATGVDVAARTVVPLGDRLKLDSPEALEQALAAGSQAEKMGKAIIRAAKAYALEHPDLPNGKEYVQIQKKSPPQFDKAGFAAAVEAVQREHPDVKLPTVEEFTTRGTHPAFTRRKKK